MNRFFLTIVALFCITMISCGFCVSEPVQIDYQNGIYHITLDGKRVQKGIKFVSSEKLMTNKEAHETSRSKFTINTGFFDPKNQKTISYIVTDRNISADPLFNENLLMNPVLRQNLDKIINRTEFRVVDCDGKINYEIVPHKTNLDFACSVVTSAQGGPMLLPELRLEEEFFILKKDGKIVRTSASVLDKTARTIIGLKGQDIHILIITNDNPMTIYEARDLCQQLGFEKAMAFDGGSSTSMNYKKSIEVVSTNDSAGRLLKSFMIVNY
ncbi:MAG TPA: phosphodiester glycosidase family protein [Candidatus Gastranaerophilaceae bacterium]|nr:phosphodiester glycosidase family protein [Candidatus Gastranaerophilaceae bacterium]HPT41875.1 phosphodiester glycosidase family protein [Candidatus Gastranaerophilaceae bacterium]